MVFLEKLERILYESERWKLIILISIISFLKIGIWYIPNVNLSIEISQNPFINPLINPEAHYLFWNWLSHFLSWLLGATGKASFIALHFSFSLAFTLLFIFIAFKYFSDNAARTSLILFSILPVSGTAYYWVGSDSITLFLILLPFAYPKRVLAVLITAIFLGMQHFEQAFFANTALLSALLVTKRQGKEMPFSLTFAKTMVIGVILGKLLLTILFQHYEIEVNTGRPYWLMKNFSSLLNYFFYHFHYAIWSILGVGWIILVQFSDSIRKNVSFFPTFFCLCLLLLIVADHTRVLAITTFPLIAGCLLFNPVIINSVPKKDVAFIFLIWILTPWSWVWAGEPKWSVFPYDVAYLLHEMLGWFNVPNDPAIWPFQSKPR